MTFLPDVDRRSSALSLLTFVASLITVILTSTPADAAPSYSVVAIKAPYYGTQTPTTWQEVAFPAAIEPRQNLVLIHPNGTEEVLFDCTVGCSVVDPSISFDGKRVYFSVYPNALSAGYNFQRNLPYLGADIYVMDLDTRALKKLTNQEWTPNTGVAAWGPDPVNGPGYRLGYGILNLAPYPVPGPEGEEWVVFVSSRDSFVPARGLTSPNLRLYLMDGLGRNVRSIGHLNIESALHPTTLDDGRVMFTSGEAQGMRDGRIWGLWAVLPDGRTFQPLMSALTSATAFHFQTQLSDKKIAVTSYYNLNNNGFGTVLAFSSDPVLSGPAFGSPVPSDPTNPDVQEGIWWFDPSHPAHQQPRYQNYPFSPIGLHNLTAFSHDQDNAASFTVGGQYAGKVTHPSGAPDGTLLVWSGGPVNDLDRPTTIPRIHAGIYLVPNNVPINDPSGLVLIKADANANYQQPRAVATHQSIYGTARPAYHPYLPDGRTPFGIVGTASLYNRNSKPGVGNARFDGLDPFNTSENGASSNWEWQGADAGKYANSDIWAIRILAMEGRSHLSYGPDGYGHDRTGFTNYAGETLRILGEIPVRKFDSQGNQPRDGDNNPDTSFKARIPADVAFTFQTLDRNGMVLNMSQTWHQVRPGETRTDCGGCHAHANNPTDFNQTAAAQPGYQTWDLIDRLTLLKKDGQGNTTFAAYTGAIRKQLMDIEFMRDVAPIIQRSCVSCHTGANAAAKLDLSIAPGSNGWAKAYNCLAQDQNANCGYKPVIPAKVWRQQNASRWIRPFQARRSLLIWKIFGARLDGWTNDSHPTESVPGDASTLPAGANYNDADLNYNGVPCPPPNSGVPALSDDEKMLIARWVDLGLPTNRYDGSEAVSNLFVDELRPTLNISWPRMETVRDLSFLEFVAHDYYSGLNLASLVVTTDFEVNGKPPGTNLASDFVDQGEGRFKLDIAQPITTLTQGVMTVQLADTVGNIVKQETVFRVDPSGQNPNPPPSPFPPGGTPPGGNPPGGNPPGGDPNNPQPSYPVNLLMADGQVNIPLTRDGRGRIRSFKLKVPVIVQNVTMPAKTKVTLMAFGSGKKLVGFGSSKSKFDLKKGTIIKWYTLTFKVPGSFAFASQLIYPSGVQTKFMTFNVIPPP